MTNTTVIGVVSEKGGTGKTTTSYQLAADLIDRNYKVVLIDNDPQKGSVRWAAGAREHNITPTIVPIENPLTQRDLAIFHGSVDFIVIDGAPGLGNDPRLRECHTILNMLALDERLPPPLKTELNEKIRKIFGFSGTVEAKLTSLVKLSDLLIIPAKPSMQDIEPTLTLVNQIVKPYQGANGRPEFRVLLTDSAKNTSLYNEVFKYLVAANIPHFKACIQNREIYRQANSGGFTVIDNTSNEKATNETKSLTTEILSTLGVTE